MYTQLMHTQQMVKNVYYVELHKILDWLIAIVLRNSSLSPLKIHSKDYTCFLYNKKDQFWKLFGEIYYILKFITISKPVLIHQY